MASETLTPNPGTMMRAVVQAGFGDDGTYEVQSVPKPGLKDGEVLVQVKAVSINKGDWHSRVGEPGMVKMAVDVKAKPIPGHDYAGVVVEVGPGVEGVEAGDEVFGMCDRGAFAEFVAARETDVVSMPAGVTFEDAAALASAGMTAIQALRAGAKLEAGDKVCIVGASGGVGSFAVQLAKTVFDADVTAVCSGRNAAVVRSLGADDVIDYTEVKA
uniref:Enoyl reductase (ER) domain-containing protein n=1 Tax=Phaeomonas parva TaxID=124430 RepID=A0A7S1U1F4_9STRA|mmetsp:Transcript_26699/g.83634  ORF Transcript_26699/g.83634 Transcript_26699/m.83634 type:complete len:215 (+) Transcript_26699:131-775(+)